MHPGEAVVKVYKDAWARRHDGLLIEISLTPSEDRAVRIVAEVTGECGFGAPQVVLNRSGDHEITARESYGWHYLFGAAANTVLLVSAGCHLPAKAQPNTNDLKPWYLRRVACHRAGLGGAWRRWSHRGAGTRRQAGCCGR
ncbi:MAG TPA: LppA family lipoprotein, partial [Pseudonocardiaceae bacterium]|nr:LppA family lipoprotein [Pseudonocardiaceae bacterium]